MAVVMRRTHDKAIYLTEDRYDPPKELTKRVSELIAQGGVLRQGGRLVDFGCGTGETLYYLRQQFPAASHCGIDHVPELLEKARVRVPGVTFKEGSLLDRSLLPPKSVDVTLMIGVHPQFEDFKPSFSNLLHWTRPGGHILIFGLFNPYPIDVWVTYRLVDDPDRDHREPGWNTFARVSVSRFLDAELGSGRHRFVPFELPFDLAPKPHDLVRTWTFHDREGRRQFTNGLLLICNLEFLEIRP